MSSMNAWSLKFVRWGMGLSVLGLVAGYFPLGHYLMKDSLPSCPTAPVHGHTILLAFVGMPICGLLYKALPGWLSHGEVPVRLVRLHFWLAVSGVTGVVVNGTLVYEILAHLVEPGFYYLGTQTQTVRNLWFAIDGLFLTLYGIGCGILLYILVTRTSYGASDPSDGR